MDRILVAKISKPQGIKGELKCQVFTDVLAVFNGEIRDFYVSGKPMRAESVKVRQGALYIKFEGINSRNDAENFRNKEITDALINQVETLNFCQTYKYPESLQVVDFVSDYRTRSDFESYNFKLENYYREKCKNQNNHKVHFTVGGIYARMKNPQVFVDLL